MHPRIGAGAGGLENQLSTLSSYSSFAVMVSSRVGWDGSSVGGISSSGGPMSLENVPSGKFSYGSRAGGIGQQLRLLIRMHLGFLGGRWKLQGS